MLKGVNHRVLEVSQPECAYFEKVLFFVKPEFSSVNENKLKDRADSYIKATSAPPSSRGPILKNEKLTQIVKMAAAAFFGAAAAGAVSFFIL